MSEAADDFREVGPWAQSIALVFQFLSIAVRVVAAGWIISNFRLVPPDSQAVVMRFGSVARVHGPGLVAAFPRPIERVVLLPGPARQIPLKVERFDAADAGANANQGYELSRDPRLNTGFLLTGDSNVVRLDAQIFYQISDPAAYMIAGEHLRPTLERLFIASSISVVGSRDLDSILVARPELAARVSQSAERESLRADLVNALNRRLTGLASAGAGLGVIVSRVDLVPAIPAAAKSGFDNVLVVTQTADTVVANAQTAAEITLQDANSKADKAATNAAASAEETVSKAKTQTASITALGRQSKDVSIGMQMTRLYYDRIEALLKKAGGVEVVDRDGAAHMILPGLTPAARPAP